MRTQETYALMQSAEEIKVALVADGDRIGGILNEQHPLPVVDGEPAFDYRQHMQNLVLKLDTAVDEAVTAEDQHSAQLIRVSRFKTDRDDAAQAGYEKLVSARQGLESIYPKGGFELAQLSGKTPRVPKKLIEQMSQTVKLLRQPAVELRDLKVEGFNVDFDAVATGLEGRKSTLESTVDQLAQARKGAEGLLVVKQGSIVALRRTVVWVGRTAEGLFYLAGEDELAARIRSSTRRPLRPSEQSEDPPADEGDSSDEPPPPPPVTES